MINYTSEIDPVTGCHNCTSHSKGNDGYFKIGHYTHYLHRYVFMIRSGVDPVGLVVRHICNNANCINPEHLTIGTHADNVADRVKAGRSAKGEKNGRRKLTEAQVIEIRNDTTSKHLHLANEYKVCPKTIRQIKNRIIWQHI